MHNASKFYVNPGPSNSSRPNLRPAPFDHMYARYRDSPDYREQIHQQISEISTEVRYSLQYDLIKEMQLANLPYSRNISQIIGAIGALRHQNKRLRNLLICYLEFTQVFLFESRLQNAINAQVIFFLNLFSYHIEV